jgi:predicted NUDIX family NTP pyrophosphohydrolase
MPKRSAGILLYRRTDHGPLVLLVHPGGPYWARKDDGAWSIPKGEIEPGEEPRSVAAREFEEETGAAAPGGAWVPLEPVRQPGGKIVHAWAVEGDFDPAGLASATFSIEWPPGSGRRAAFPEVDRAEWFPLSTARRRLSAGQVPLLDQLACLVAAGEDSVHDRLDGADPGGT